MGLGEWLCGRSILLKSKVRLILLLKCGNTAKLINMKTVDLNADIGEAEDESGIASELAILRYVSSANIACGGHRGDVISMRRTVREALKNNVAIGAHPAYSDRANFGRKSMMLGQDIEESELRKSLTLQIQSLIEIAASEGANVTYVKPHGALYNDSVHSRSHADLIASVIHSIDPSLAFMGAPNSQMGAAAKQLGIRFISEGFIDRRYTDDGHLQSRSIDGAVIKDNMTRMAQLQALVTTGEIETASGNSLTLKCESLCLHGDSAGAVEMAKHARQLIEAAGVKIRSIPCAANYNTSKP